MASPEAFDASTAKLQPTEEVNTAEVLSRKIWNTFLDGRPATQYAPQGTFEHSPAGNQGGALTAFVNATITEQPVIDHLNGHTSTLANLEAFLATLNFDRNRNLIDRLLKRFQQFSSPTWDRHLKCIVLVKALISKRRFVLKGADRLFGERMARPSEMKTLLERLLNNPWAQTISGSLEPCYLSNATYGCFLTSANRREEPVSRMDDFELLSTCIITQITGLEPGDDSTCLLLDQVAQRLQKHYRLPRLDIPLEFQPPLLSDEVPADPHGLTEYLQGLLRAYPSEVQRFWLDEISDVDRPLPSSGNSLQQLRMVLVRQTERANAAAAARQRADFTNKGLALHTSLAAARANSDKLRMQAAEATAAADEARLLFTAPYQQQSSVSNVLLSPGQKQQAEINFERAQSAAMAQLQLQELSANQAQAAANTATALVHSINDHLDNHRAREKQNENLASLKRSRVDDDFEHKPGSNTMRN